MKWYFNILNGKKKEKEKRENPMGLVVVVVRSSDHYRWEVNRVIKKSRINMAKSVYSSEGMCDFHQWRRKSGRWKVLQRIPDALWRRLRLRRRRVYFSELWKEERVITVNKEIFFPNPHFVPECMLYFFIIPMELLVWGVVIRLRYPRYVFNSTNNLMILKSGLK